MKVAITASIFALVLMPAVAAAAPAEVKFSGTIKTATCTVSSSTPNLDVKLGDVFAENLVDGSPIGYTQFPAGIELTCAGGEQVAIAFQNGTHGDPASGLLNPSGGAARGFRLGIYNAAKDQQRINERPTANSYVTVPAGSTSAKLDYSVAVVKTAGEPLVNGDFEATATLLVDQQ